MGNKSEHYFILQPTFNNLNRQNTFSLKYVTKSEL